MKNGISNKNQVLHFFDSYICNYFIYHLYSKSEMHILPAFQHFTNYAERQWGYKIMIFYRDGKIAILFGLGFDNWVV